MASKDDDNGPEENKGGGLPGAIGAVGGIYGGGLAASHLVGKPNDEKKAAIRKAHTDAQTEYDKKLATEVTAKPENAKIHADFKAAEGAHLHAEGNHLEAVSDEWERVAEELSAERMGKLHLVQAKSAYQALEKGTSSVARTHLAGVFKEQAIAVEKLIATDEFKKLTVEEAREKLADTSATASANYKAKNPVPEGAKAEMEQTREALRKDVLSANNEAMAKLEPELAKKVAEAEAVKASKTALETAATDLTKKKEAWTKIEGDALKAEKTALDVAKKKAASLAELETLNTQKGAKALFARPFKVFKHVGKGAKFAIIGSAVALGAIVYKGIGAMRGGSHAERIEEERQTGGAGQSMA